MSSSSSSSSSSSTTSPSSSALPYFCPRCGDSTRFSSVPELRVHLVNRHTYETLLALSQVRARSTGPAALLPAGNQAVSQKQSSIQALEALTTIHLPPSCLDLASSSASIHLLRTMFSPPGGVISPSAGHLVESATALALPSSLGPLAGRSHSNTGVQLGLRLDLSVDIGLEERLGLGLDRQIVSVIAAVEERVNQHLSELRLELQRKESELQLEKVQRERLKSEKQEVEERAHYLSRQICAATKMSEQLKKDLEVKKKELLERQQEMVDIECFLRETAEREAEAKSRLQVFIETLLERADRAEQQLFIISSRSHRKYTHARHHGGYAPVSGCGGQSLDSSADDIITDRLETLGNRRSFSISGSCRLGEPLCRRSGLSGHMRTLSLGSGVWDSEEYWDHLRLTPNSPSWTCIERGEGRRGDSMRERQWLEKGGGLTWSKPNRRNNSTEEEEEPEEEEDKDDVIWSSSEIRRLVFARTGTPGSDDPSSLCSTPSHHSANRQLVADALRMRAGLFCVFPYLDIHSLLCAAEVCSDWRFVARHPAVWTRLRIENARVSSEFLRTLSQWCTQTQSIILANLKPRSRFAEENREDHHKNTRGCLEPGLEALLRSAGGSLLHLSVSQCANILTERTLWLASCYCRNLEILTYRSSSHPPTQEVLWALGAGCRNISTLQVAPSHPCQQTTVFGDRCLQTIGRCWPQLRSLSVGGAGCGTQGLLALVRSCAHLQVLELERITDMGLQVVTELCEVGLNHLTTLILTHTPVSGQAILHFHSVCRNLRSIIVKVSPSDYFEEPNSQEAQHLFGEILSTLKVLQKHPGLCDVLRVRAEGFF